MHFNLKFHRNGIQRVFKIPPKFNSDSRFYLNMNFNPQNSILISHDQWNILKESNFLRFFTIKGVIPKEF